MLVETSWRVKVYELEEQGSWRDRGTGHVTLKNLEGQDGPVLIVVSEERRQVLLQSKVQAEENYEHQGENIIMWREMNEEGQTVHDLALSFQESNGFKSIWKRIVECQQQMMHQKEGPMTEGSMCATANLPECTLENVEDIRNILCAANPNQRDAHAQFMKQDGAQYLRILLQLFAGCELAEDLPKLKMLAQIMRCVLFLNDAELVELVLTDELFLQVAGCLEYDPDLKVKADYREFLGKRARLKQVVPIEDEELIQRIHQNFRIKHMKENMLRPSLDESGITALNSLQQFNNGDICFRFFRNYGYLKTICNIIVNSDSEQNSRHEALFFLRELFSLSKGGTISMRLKWYEDLSEKVKVIPAILLPLQKPVWGPLQRQASAEILVAIVQVYPGCVHEIILVAPPIQLPPHVIHAAGAQAPSAQTSTAMPASDNEECILFVLVRRLVEDGDTAVQEQIVECLRSLLDPEKMEKLDKDNILQLFYDSYLHWLITPFVEGYRYTRTRRRVAPVASMQLETASSSDSSAGRASELQVDGPSPSDMEEGMPDDPADESQGMIAAASSRRHICEFLSLCAQCHSYRMKYFIMRNNLISRVLRLLHSKHRHLHLAAIKFVRAVLQVNDDFYHRHIIKHDLFKPIFVKLRECSNKDNLLTSQVIEMIEYIKQENLKSLIAYIVEKYSESFREVSHVDTFDKLQQRYAQHQAVEEDLRGRSNAEVSDGRRRLDEQQRRIAEVEAAEAYFDADDDDTGNPLQLLSQYRDEDEARTPPDDPDPDPTGAHQRAPHLNIEAQKEPEADQTLHKRKRLDEFHAGAEASEATLRNSTQLKQDSDEDLSPSKKQRLRASAYSDAQGVQGNGSIAHHLIRPLALTTKAEDARESGHLKSLLGDGWPEDLRNESCEMLLKPPGSALSTGLSRSEVISRPKSAASTQGSPPDEPTSIEALLPPLKPKYESDEELGSEVFFRRVLAKSPQSTPVIQAASPVTGANTAESSEVRASQATGSGSGANSSGISFSLKRKPRLQILG